MLRTNSKSESDIYIIMIHTIYFKTCSDKDNGSKIWDNKTN